MSRAIDYTLVPFDPADPQVQELLSREQRLAHDAWTDPGSMQVLVDLLLERGDVLPVTTEDVERATQSPTQEPGDLALFQTEVRARCWILRYYSHDLELRIAGGWPDLSFVVCVRDVPARGSRPRRVPFARAPAAGTPRLLRVNPG